MTPPRVATSGSPANDPTPHEIAARIAGRVDEALAEIRNALADLTTLAQLASRNPTAAAVSARLLTDREVAVVLGIGKSTVHQLKKEGVLVGVTIGSLRRWPVEEVDAYITRLKQERGA